MKDSLETLKKLKNDYLKVEKALEKLKETKDGHLSGCYTYFKNIIEKLKEATKNFTQLPSEKQETTLDYGFSFFRQTSIEAQQNPSIETLNSFLADFSLLPTQEENDQYSDNCCKP